MVDVPSGDLVLSGNEVAVNTELIVVPSAGLSLSSATLLMPAGSSGQTADLGLSTFAPTVTQTASAAVEVPSANLALSRATPNRAYQITWVAPESNPDLLCPQEFTMDLVFQSGTGGRSIGGKKQYLQSDAGYWRVVYGNIRIRSNADVLKWRETELQAEGRANPILIEAWDRKRAPIPLDGSPIVASANATAAVGTATVQILLTNGSPLIAGMHFSTPTYRLYRIRKIVSQVGNVYTVKVRPPLREQIGSGTDLEFDYPKLLVRLEKDDSMNVVLDLMLFASPTVAFVEEPVKNA